MERGEKKEEGREGGEGKGGYPRERATSEAHNSATWNFRVQ